MCNAIKKGYFLLCVACGTEVKSSNDSRKLLEFHDFLADFIYIDYVEYYLSTVIWIQNKCLYIFYSGTIYISLEKQDCIWP